MNTCISYILTHNNIHSDVYMYVHACIYIYVCMYVCIRQTYIYKHTYIHKCMQTRVHVHLYIISEYYIYIYTVYMTTMQGASTFRAPINRTPTAVFRFPKEACSLELPSKVVVGPQGIWIPNMDFNETRDKTPI